MRDQWAKVLDFKDGDFPSSHQEATMDVIMRLNQAKSGVNILSKPQEKPLFYMNIILGGVRNEKSCSV